MAACILISFFSVVIMIGVVIGSLEALNNHDRYQITREVENNARSRRYRNNIAWREVIRHIQSPTQGEDHSPWNSN